MSAFKRRTPSAAPTSSGQSGSPSASSSSSSSTPGQRPIGTRVSAYNASLLVSTGLASLDDILGGGLPVGSLCVLHQDLVSAYAKLILKFFLAQGLVSGQECAVWTADGDSELQDFERSLPGLDAPGPSGAVGDQKKQQQSESAREDDKMKIAFNYANLGKFQRSVESQPEPPGSGQSEYCSTFDLSQQMTLSPETRARYQCMALDPEAGPQDLFVQIRNIVSKRTADAPPLRLVVHSLASPFAAPDSWTPSSTYRFLHALRHLLRTSPSVTAIVSIPAHLHPSSSLTRWHHAADAVLNFQSFASSPELAAQFPRYNGLVHVLRLPTTSSMVPPSTKLSVLRGLATRQSGGGGAGGMDNNLAFRVKRRRFAIETLHLDVGGGSNERQVPDNEKNKAKEEVVKKEQQQQHQDKSISAAPKKTFGPAVKSSNKPTLPQDW